MDIIKTSHKEIDDCTEEVIVVLKKHGLCLDSVETVFDKVKLAIRCETPVFGSKNYCSDNSTNTEE